MKDSRGLHIHLSDNTEIYAEMIEMGSPLWIIMTHGVGEHLGRHRYLFKLLSEHFNIFLYDLRGHGQSEGRRGYIKDFSQYRFDLAEIISFLKENFRMQKFILMGHSMGSLVVADTIHHLKEHNPERVFLSAPPIAPGGLLGEFLSSSPKITRKLTTFSPSLPLRGLVDLHKLSHDGIVFENYITDKLNCLSLHTKLLLGMIDTANTLFRDQLDYQGPVAATIGTHDEIVSVEAFRNYIEKYGRNFQVQYIEGAYHEMHNEIEKFKKPYFQFVKDFMYGALDDLSKAEAINQSLSNSEILS